MNLTFLRPYVRSRHVAHFAHVVAGRVYKACDSKDPFRALQNGEIDSVTQEASTSGLNYGLLIQCQRNLDTGLLCLTARSKTYMCSTHTSDFAYRHMTASDALVVGCYELLCCYCFWLSCTLGNEKERPQWFESGLSGPRVRYDISTRVPVPLALPHVVFDGGPLIVPLDGPVFARFVARDLTSCGDVMRWVHQVLLTDVSFSSSSGSCFQQKGG